MSKIKNGGLNQYGIEPFEQQRFGISGVEGVKFEGVMCPNDPQATVPLDVHSVHTSSQVSRPFWLLLTVMDKALL